MASFAVPNNNYASFCVLLFLFFSLGMVADDVAGAEDDPITLFIFGDSTTDVGTNNFLNTSAQANFAYNGIDFPHSVPTGRFSNGFNTADQVARLLGHKRSPPPYLALEQRQSRFKRNILQGVNFASGGSGILRETGRQWGEVVSLEEQVKQFGLVRANISETLGVEEAAPFVSKALFVISVGSNDVFDYLSGKSGILLGTLEFMGYLQQNYYVLIRKLYELGARKFGIVGIPPIGCCPAVRAKNYERSGRKGCEKGHNDLARAFFSQTESLLKRLSSELEGMRYSLGNSFAMTVNMLEDPLVFGLKETRKACCGVGEFNGDGPCFEPNGTELCGDRRDHMFWDWFHPTEKVSELAALTLYGGGRRLATPMNLSQLARIHVP